MSCEKINCNKDVVNISGICEQDDVVKAISENPYWVQMCIPETLTIPENQLDIEELDSVDVLVNIVRSKVIKTPISSTDESGNVIPNLEGKISTGRKVIVEGVLCERINYTPVEGETPLPLSWVNFYVPFSAYIVVPKEIAINNGTTTTLIDSLDLNFDIGYCIENINIKLVDTRTIAKRVTLMLYATPGQ